MATKPKIEPPQRKRKVEVTATPVKKLVDDFQTYDWSSEEDTDPVVEQEYFRQIRESSVRFSHDSVFFFFKYNLLCLRCHGYFSLCAHDHFFALLYNCCDRFTCNKL